MSALLPPSSSPLERAIEAAAELNINPQIATLWDAETCPESTLPWLAWSLHLTDSEGWRLAKTTEQRRALIARSASLHRKKGTPWSIREALKAVGFNDLEIVERLPKNCYDGTINHTGGEYYNAYGWAQFRVTADVGDNQPINDENTKQVAETINEWKPVRCHLVDVQYRASVTETVSSSEATTVAAELTQEDSHLWGRRLYDGSLSFNQGLLRTHEGAFAFSGVSNYSGFTAAGERFDAEREADEMAGALMISDVQSRGPLFDGFGDYGGAIDFGASAPVAEDLPMPIVATRHLSYDGRHAFSAHRFDGLGAYAGEFAYFGNIPYAGDVSTTLEA